MTAAQNKVVLSYHITRGLYFQAVIFAATVVTLYPRAKTFLKSHDSVRGLYFLALIFAASII